MIFGAILESISRKNLFITFIVDCTHVMRTYIMKSNEVFQKKFNCFCLV